MFAPLLTAALALSMPMPAVVLDAGVPPAAPAAALVDTAAGAEGEFFDDAVEYGCGAHDDEGLVEIVDFAVGTGVERRVLTGASDRFPLTTARVYAHVTLESAIETTVDIVWYRGESEVQRLTLDVGPSPRWRTWSYRTLRPRDAGRWTVEVRDADGSLLDMLAFDVADPVAPTVSRR